MDINEMKVKLFEMRREIDTLNSIQQQKVVEYNKLMEILITKENEEVKSVEKKNEMQSKTSNGINPSGQEGKDKGVSKDTK